jgi:hypothetical protein
LRNHILKVVFILACILFGVNIAKGQNTDTVVTYFKFGKVLSQKVNTVDSADYIRILYPDSVGGLYSIREYYTNGVPKFMGDIDTRKRKFPVEFVGDCISFYPNGKKQSFAHYTDGKKLGMEYIFRPDGHLYAVKKWVFKYIIYNDDFYWECYDKDGNAICENGNGRWVIYDTDFKNIILRGNVKNGYMDGIWQGAEVIGDSIRYSLNYNKSLLISGIGYDRTGKAYPFTSLSEEANYKDSNIFDFLSDLRKNLKIPKDLNGKRINIDTVHISFVIEPDGHVSQLELLGNANSNLKEAINAAITKCANWTPNKYYGVPFRTWLVTSLKIKEEYNTTTKEEYLTTTHTKTIDYKGNIIDFVKPDNSSVNSN